MKAFLTNCRGLCGVINEWNNFQQWKLNLMGWGGMFLDLDIVNGWESVKVMFQCEFASSILIIALLLHSFTESLPTVDQITWIEPGIENIFIHTNQLGNAPFNIRVDIFDLRNRNNYTAINFPLWGAPHQRGMHSQWRRYKNCPVLC